MQIDIKDVQSVREALEKTPLGIDMAKIANQLGLWTKSSHLAPPNRRPFPSKISKLGPGELSDEQAYWTSEFGRIIELIGVLEAQQSYLKLRSKTARAKARVRVRETLEVKVTAGEIQDKAEQDPNVQEVDEKLLVVELILASAQAAKEATSLYLSSISREISFRCSQMDNRLYGGA